MASLFSFLVGRDREDVIVPMRLRRQDTFWLGPLGFTVVWAAPWLSRIAWVWGYWR